MPPQEESADFPDFDPIREHLLFKGVYGDFPHHNDRLNLGGGFPDNAIWKRCWRRLAAQLVSCYATPSGAVGCRFTAILAAEWRGVFDRSWNSKRPLVFVHVIITKILGVRRAREIRSKITRRIDLLERGLHSDLVGVAEMQGDDREGRATRVGEY